MEPFLILFKQPLACFSFFFLILSFVSVWINRRLWIWGFFYAISYCLAYYSGIVELKALVPIGILFVCQFFVGKDVKGFWRLFCVLIASVLSIGFTTHFIIGFHNILLIPNWVSSPGALPMNIYLNFDKPVIGLFVLGCSLPLISTWKGLGKMLIITIPWTVVTLFVILGVAKYLNLVEFDPKLPGITLAWLFIQLFFVVIPEEAFYRGFVQREIDLGLKNSFGGILAVLVTALLFTLIHIFFIPDPSYLIVVFVTSIFYGGIYAITGSIESAILVHFITNTAHFFFFTYPLLQRAVI